MPSTAGTTASVAFIRKGKLYTGHVGDSRIVLGVKEEGNSFYKMIWFDHEVFIVKSNLLKNNVNAFRVTFFNVALIVMKSFAEKSLKQKSEFKKWLYQKKTRPFSRLIKGFNIYMHTKMNLNNSLKSKLNNRTFVF